MYESVWCYEKGRFWPNLYEQFLQMNIGRVICVFMASLLVSLSFLYFLLVNLSLIVNTSTFD